MPVPGVQASPGILSLSSEIQRLPFDVYLPTGVLNGSIVFEIMAVRSRIKPISSTPAN
jgi:hypothetical protein